MDYLDNPPTALEVGHYWAPILCRMWVNFRRRLTHHKGKVELAGEGTLFLDEIAELSPRMQGKLLRLLEQREYIPVGGSLPQSSRCRFITATNVDLEARVAQESFRADLFYRLHVVNIALPSLRERKNDLPPLVEHLLKKIGKSLGKRIRRVPMDILNRLMAHDWPGNVRQLENVLLKAAVLEVGETLTLTHLPPDFQSPCHATVAIAAQDSAAPEHGSLKDMERDHIMRVLDSVGGHKSQACEILGISRPRLDRRLKEFEADDAATAGQAGFPVKM